MAVNINVKQSAVWCELSSEPYYHRLLERAANVLKCDDRRVNRRFYGFVDGLLKASDLHTRELRINRQIRQLVTLVNKSIEDGTVDPTLESILNENQLSVSDRI